MGRFSILSFCYVMLIIGIANVYCTNNEKPTKVKSTHVMAHHSTAPNAQGNNNVEVRPAMTLACPPGYWFEKHKCVSKTVVPPSIYCPSGYIEENNTCVKWIVPESHSCPDGTVLKGIDCHTRLLQPLMASCPKDTILVNDTHCKVPLDKPFICPDGTAVVGNSCLKLGPMTKSCPAGFQLFGGVCSRTELSEPVAACPTGMILQGAVCTTDTMSLDPTCPPNTIDLGDQCARYHSMISECPDGYNLTSADTCLKVSNVPKIPACGNGGDASKGCRMSVEIPLAEKCETGSKLVNGVCEAPILLPAQISCSDGFIVNGTECTNLIEFDCSETSFTVECDSASNIVKSAKESNVRGLAGTDDGAATSSDDIDVSNVRGAGLSANSSSPSSSEGSGIRKLTNLESIEHPPKKELSLKVVKQDKSAQHAHGEHAGINHHNPIVGGGVMSQDTPILPICRKVPTIINRTCNRVAKADPTPICNEGILKAGNKCEVMRIVDSTKTCEGRVDSSGKCVLEQTSSIYYECPMGFTDDGPSTNVCSTSETVEPIVGCPPGTEGPQCASYVPKDCRGGVCSHAAIQPAIDTCPDGFIKTTTPTKVIDKFTHDGLAFGKNGKPTKKLVHGGKQMVSILKTTCVKSHYADMIGHCAEGWEQIDSVSCALAVEPIDVSKNHVIAASIVCPQDYALTDDGCELINIVAATAHCPADSTQDGNRCYISMLMRQECPSGSTQENLKCWVISYSEPLTVETIVEGVKVRSAHSKSH